jgi:hypothetical protein
VHDSFSKFCISTVGFLLLGARVKMMACCAAGNKDIIPERSEVSPDSLESAVL